LKEYLVVITVMSVALAMDAFAIAVTLGMDGSANTVRERLKVSTSFGFFQRLLLKNRGYRRTELGKEETEKWLVYYDFLYDFTRIKEKDLGYNELLENDYPYAVGLGLNKVLKLKYGIEEGEIIR